MSSEFREIFLKLVKLGIANVEEAVFKSPVSGSIDWVALKALAERQGLTAVVLDGLNTVQGEQLMARDSMPQMLRLEWIGEVLQDYEARYTAYEKAIRSLAGWYNQYGYRMMILKGYACGLDWPKPEHRPCGDIDIWLFGQQRKADADLGSWLKVHGSRSAIDTSHHHHTVFEWQGYTVENHYDFINVHHHKSHVEFEKILKELGRDDSYSISINGDKVYLPSTNLHALFLIKHLMLHFSTGEITLRQLLDWGFFVEKHGKDVDWPWLHSILERFGMKDLYNVFNAICVRDLGFNANIFPHFHNSPELKHRVLNDIISPEFGLEMPRTLMRRVVWKWNRWKANEWKHKLCYKESMWSAFWSGVWGHLLKPKSI